MTRTPKQLALAAASTATVALAAAPAAFAGGDVPRITPPDIPFPSDRIEHRVIEHCEQSTPRFQEWSRNGCVITDAYITSDRDREITRDATTKELVAESATIDSTIFSWTSRRNELVVAPAQGTGPSNITREAEAEMVRETVRRGWYAEAGEETRDGRAVVVLRETAQAPDTDGESTVVVAKDTYEVLERRMVTANGERTFSDRVLKVEQLPRSAQNEKLLALGDHLGASVRRVEGDGATIARAAKRMGMKARTRRAIARRAAAQAKSRKARRS